MKKVLLVEDDIFISDMIETKLTQSGFEVLEEIRKIPEYTNLPVIILSNENGTDVEDRAKSLDAQYYFKAMTDINELIPILNESLK